MTVDASGEVVSVSVAEPRFTVADVALLIAARRDALAPRGAHGYLLSEAADPEFQYDWEIQPPRRDFAQTKINAQQDEYRKLYPDADLSPLLWRVERSTT